MPSCTLLDAFSCAGMHVVNGPIRTGYRNLFSWYTACGGGIQLSMDQTERKEDQGSLNKRQSVPLRSCQTLEKLMTSCIVLYVIDKKKGEMLSGERVCNIEDLRKK